MKSLHAGVKKFRDEHVAKEKEFYRGLADGQNPRCLFITCSDSRIVPNALTQTGPGELFMLRNPGNIIQPYKKGEVSAEAATIEFSLELLELEDIVICGHAHCSAVETVVNKLPLPNTPILKKWLTFIEPISKSLESRYAKKLEGQVRLQAAVAENVVLQMEHLLSYPIVRERVESKKLNIHGWYYELESGEVLAFNEETQQFDNFLGGKSSLPKRKHTHG